MHHIITNLIQGTIWPNNTTKVHFQMAVSTLYIAWRRHIPSSNPVCQLLEDSYFEMGEKIFSTQEEGDQFVLYL